MAKKRKSKQRKKRNGHYCWCCDHFLPNERFGGKGHRLHLCKSCQRLPQEERDFRSERSNLYRCVTWDGIIPKKRRKPFNRFLQHADPKIRKIAQQLQREDQLERARLNRDEREFDEFSGNVNLDFDIAASDWRWFDDDELARYR